MNIAVASQAGFDVVASKLAYSVQKAYDIDVVVLPPRTLPPAVEPIVARRVLVAMGVRVPVSDADITWPFQTDNESGACIVVGAAYDSLPMRRLAAQSQETLLSEEEFSRWVVGHEIGHCIAAHFFRARVGTGLFDNVFLRNEAFADLFALMLTKASGADTAFFKRIAVIREADGQSRPDHATAPWLRCALRQEVHPRSVKRAAHAALKALDSPCVSQESAVVSASSHGDKHTPDVR